MIKFCFLKIATFTLTLSPWKIKLASDILISNNCANIYLNPLINARARKMAKFFLYK